MNSLLSPVQPETNTGLRKFAYFLGPLLFLLTFVAGPPVGMSLQGWRVCGLAMWMALWWMTEAMPLSVTSLIPIVVLPIANILPMKTALSSFSNPIVFLFLGGFLLSLAMEKWNLHLRIGLGILRTVGHGGKSILAGLMLATAFLGMWISNTATVIMMLPMAVSISVLLSQPALDEGDTPRNKNMFAKAMVLGVAYSAVIGGLATFVGTPTNAVLQSYMVKQYNYSFSLSQWMMFGVPLSLVLLVLGWLLLVHRYVRHANVSDDVRDIVKTAFADLGPMVREEKLVLAVFIFVASLWIFSTPLEHIFGIVLDDAIIGILGGILLFIIPLDSSFSNFALRWRDTQKLPWGILIFFGGSLALSDALTDTGVINWLSLQMAVLHKLNIAIVVTIVMLMVIFMSELMSNIATVTAFTPIIAALAQAMGVNPLIILIPSTLAASTAFALPGASAPNALAYGTGYVKVRDMISTGFILNLISLAALLFFTFTLVSWSLGIDTHSLPAWAQLH